MAGDILQDTGMSPVFMCSQQLWVLHDPCLTPTLGESSGASFSHLALAGGCLWLLFHPITHAGSILLWNSENLTKICPALLALLKTSYWLLISQSPCVSQKSYFHSWYASICFPEHLVSFWMLCNPQLAIYYQSAYSQFENIKCFFFLVHRFGFLTALRCWKCFIGAISLIWHIWLICSCTS